MRFVALACFAVALLFSSADAFAQKAKPSSGAASCNRMACTQTCISRGGRSQYCASWCDQQIAASPKCK